MARKDAARKDAAYNPKLKELHKEKQLLLSNASHTDKDKQIDIINKKIAEELLSFQRIGLEKEISSLKSISKSEILVSVTGVAGPKGGNLKTPVGCIYFGFGTKIKNKYNFTTIKKTFREKSRKKIQIKTTEYVLKEILKNISKI